MNTPQTEKAPEVVVTQSDREAVQAFHKEMTRRLMLDLRNPDRPKLGEDEGDAGTLVQAFARHRIAASGGVERLMKRCDGDLYCLDAPHSWDGTWSQAMMATREVIRATLSEQTEVHTLDAVVERERGQAEGFAAAVAWLRERSAMNPPATLHHAAAILADQMEQSRIASTATQEDR